MEIEVTLDIEEQDILIFNDKEWKVKNIYMGTFDLEPTTGKIQNFTREELQEYIDFSGKFVHIKSDYIGF